MRCHVAACLGACLILPACQPPGSGSLEANNNASDTVKLNEDTPNEVANEAGDSDGNEHAPPVSPAGASKALAGSLATGTITLPAALNKGVFSRKGNCLQVTVSGISYTPILAGEAAFTQDGFAVGPEKFRFGTAYRLEGGPVLFGDVGIIVPEVVRKNCPQEYYAAAKISEG